MVNVGATVWFTCTSGEQTRWYFNEERLPSNAQVRVLPLTLFSVLTISNVTVANQGAYQCHGDIDDYYYFEAEASLVVKRKLYF